MQTFADWLRHYNQEDVARGLETLEKMKAFYTKKVIDIFMDAVSIPGVSMQYVLRSPIDPGADLWSPCKEAFDMVKAVVTSGPSLLFTRYHEVGVTEIRSHQEENAKVCQRILGYDDSALYLPTLLQDMPCREGTVRHNSMPAAIQGFLSQRKSVE